jgi:hypothetical protein
MMRVSSEDFVLTSSEEEGEDVDIGNLLALSRERDGVLRDSSHGRTSRRTYEDLPDVPMDLMFAQ